MTDVIPPFGKNVQPPEESVEGPQPRNGTPNATSRVWEPTYAAGNPVIPSYDLAENILAEQRRAAGQRRRRLGRAEGELVVSSHAGARSFAPLPSGLAAQDLLELQHVVAEIVARDIERLCRRPVRSSAFMRPSPA